MQKLNVSIILFFMLLFASTLNAQKRSLVIEDIELWNKIAESIISPNGNWIAYIIKPWRGDSKVFLYNSNGGIKFKSDCGKKIIITDDSEFMIFEIEPEYEYVRDLKLRKTKKEDMPGTILGIYTINSGRLDSINNILSYKIPDDWAGWLAYQVEIPSGKVGEGNSMKKESARNGFMLNLMNLESGKISSWPFVTEYYFAEKSRKLFFLSTGDDGKFEAGIYFYDLTTEQIIPVITGKKDYKQISVSEKGDMLAFLLGSDSENKSKEYSLCLWTGKGKAKEVVTNNSLGIPENWSISENGKISYSDNGRRIFFGIAPLCPEKDTTILDDEYPGLDVWHGSEGLLHSVQLVNKDSELKRTYLTMV